ncbi:MAG: 50S ribosomal protein L28 [Thermacetogeniaceae bacterium]
MAICAVCGKKARIGMQVSHSHIRTKRSWSPNLQPIRTLVKGKPVRLMVCTRCLKAGKIKRAL